MAICGSRPRPWRLYCCARRRGQNPRQCSRENIPGLVAALERWIFISSISPGEALFRSIKKGGHIRGRLRDGGVSLALKARIARYLEASGYTQKAAEAG